MEAKNQETTGNNILIAAGIFLGLGLNGFIDGILLHQILQWHHVISNVKPLNNFPNIDLNMAWDGLFHVLDWIFTVIGIILLWQAGGRKDVIWSAQTFSGAIFLGAGLFNLVEGVIDHHLLVLHHVKMGQNQLVWDLGFLGLGLILVILGWVMIQRSKIVVNH
ncbi:MAG TPA: DUF2243 domain-containing protein [Nostocaceae cyanobacterium]|nr:DUF2243 domain-containing protein [Nostocaceae cyanobacterium]